MADVLFMIFLVFIAVLIITQVIPALVIAWGLIGGIFVWLIGKGRKKYGH